MRLSTGIGHSTRVAMAGYGPGSGLPPATGDAAGETRGQDRRRETRIDVAGAGRDDEGTTARILAISRPPPPVSQRLPQTDRRR